MSSRLAFDAWQMLFPAIGFCLFAAIFIGVVVRVVRMKRSSLGHMEQLPFQDESTRTADHVRTK